jgi:hypothetical protein
MIDLEEDRFRLTIPVHDAVWFAMGWSDLGYNEPNNAMRKLVGFLAINALEFDEQWRAAALLRMCLEKRWPELQR